MNNTESLQGLLATQNIEVSILGFVINLALAGVLALILGQVYIRFGSVLSNRRMFARNLTILALTTTLVITIVKSSLALSLGLVGALSIVRFRSAIKEPEELGFLFMAIGIGLGMGANQIGLTIVAMIIIMGFLIGRNFWQQKDENQNLHITVSSDDPSKVRLPDVVEVLKKTTRNIELKRFDQTKDFMEASFLVEFEDYGQLEQSRQAVEAFGDSVSITFVDNKGLN